MTQPSSYLTQRKFLWTRKLLVAHLMVKSAVELSSNTALPKAEKVSWLPAGSG